MSNKNNGYYGLMAGTFTAATLQPFDNIKMGLIVPPQGLSLTRNFITNVCLVTKYIHKEEGARAFYKGLVSNVWKTGLSSAIYFYCLRTIEQTLSGGDDSLGKKNLITQFMSSCLARITSAILTNPLAVVQSRYELVGKQKWEGSVANSIKKIYQGEGVKGLLNGGLATCYKEGSFAGLYYTLYESGKSYEIPSVVSGLVSGVIATFITHPFEIVRTNNQVYLNFHGPGQSENSLSIFQQLKVLGKEGDLLKGVAPRLIKKPLANTLAFTLFQFMERFNKNQEISNI